MGRSVAQYGERRNVDGVRRIQVGLPLVAWPGPVRIRDGQARDDVTTLADWSRRGRDHGRPRHGGAGTRDRQPLPGAAILALAGPRVRPAQRPDGVDRFSRQPEARIARRQPTAPALARDRWRRRARLLASRDGEEAGVAAGFDALLLLAVGCFRFPPLAAGDICMAGTPNSRPYSLGIVRHVVTFGALVVTMSSCQRRSQTTRLPSGARRS